MDVEDIGEGPHVGVDAEDVNKTPHAKVLMEASCCSRRRYQRRYVVGAYI